MAMNAIYPVKELLIRRCHLGLIARDAAADDVFRHVIAVAVLAVDTVIGERHWIDKSSSGCNLAWRTTAVMTVPAEQYTGLLVGKPPDTAFQPRIAAILLKKPMLGVGF